MFTRKTLKKLQITYSVVILCTLNIYIKYKLEIYQFYFVAFQIFSQTSKLGYT